MRERLPALGDRRVLAAAAGVLVVIVALVAVFALGGGRAKKSSAIPARGTASAARPATTAPATTSTGSASTPSVSSASTSQAATSTSAIPTQSTAVQLPSLIAILTLAKTGRQDLANGNLAAAIANRRSILQQLQGLHPDSELGPSVRALQAAVAYSLHADTTCGLSCPPSVNQHATQLKRSFVTIFNAVAARHHTATYTAGEI